MKVNVLSEKWVSDGARMNLIFDLDGLIINSLPGLAIAMVGAVSPLLPDKQSLELFTEFDFGNPGMTRFDKVEKALDMAGLEGSDREVARNESLKLFDELSLRARTEAELDDNIFRFGNLKGAKLSVLSNCDNAILPTVIASHGMQELFAERLFGTPPGKRETLSTLLRLASNAGSRFIFISDSESDYQVAIDCGVEFVYIERFSRAISVPKQMSKTSFETLGAFYESLST